MKKVPLLLITSLLFGCAKETKTSSAGAAGTGTTSTTSVLSTLPQVTLKLVSSTAFAAYSTYYNYYSPFNQVAPATTNPTDLKLGVKLTSDQGVGGYGGRYSGQVVIGYNYVDTNGVTQYQESVFKAEHVQNPSIDQGRDNGTWRDEFNRFFKSYGNNAFSGFFSDPYGAIVFVVEGSTISNTGVETGLLYGSIYFRNYEASSSPLNPSARMSPYRTCWFIYTGPFNCNSESVKSKSSIVPDGYTKLATFSNLPKTDAFK